MNIKSFFKAVARRVAVCLFYIVGLPLLWLCEPVFGIRIGTVYTQRIGHLAANTDVFFRQRANTEPHRRRTYILTGWDPANRQLFKMFARTCGIIESRILTWIVFSCRDALKRTRFWQPMPFKGTEYKIYNTTAPIISFTAAEERHGRQELEKMGLGADDWFIGFHCRDAAYLDAWRPQEAGLWRTIDFKNANIHSYLDAAKHVTELGGYAFRMGAVVERPLEGPLPDRLIDYATRFRSDFMDIYIAAKCRFFLASSTGLGHVPTVFGRPVVVANHFPYNHTHYRSDDLIVPRPVLTLDTREPVPFHEAQNNGFFAWEDAPGVTSKGQNADLYDWGHNDPEDILNGVLDMLDILEGRDPPAGALEIQERYRQKYLSHLPDYHMGAKLSPRYALHHERLI